jgi:hypothetical protein
MPPCTGIAQGGNSTGISLVDFTMQCLQVSMRVSSHKLTEQYLYSSHNSDAPLSANSLRHRKHSNCFCSTMQGKVVRRCVFSSGGLGRFCSLQNLHKRSSNVPELPEGIGRTSTGVGAVQASSRSKRIERPGGL